MTYFFRWLRAKNFEFIDVMFFELAEDCGLEGSMTYLFCVSFVKLVRLDSVGGRWELFDTASCAACNNPPSRYASVGDAKPVDLLIEF